MVSEQEVQREVDIIKQQMEEQQREKLNCFSMCFRLKVVDAMNYHKEGKPL